MRVADPPSHGSWDPRARRNLRTRPTRTHPYRQDGTRRKGACRAIRHRINVASRCFVVPSKRGHTRVAQLRMTLLSDNTRASGATATAAPPCGGAAAGRIASVWSSSPSLLPRLRRRAPPPFGLCRAIDMRRSPCDSRRGLTALGALATAAGGPTGLASTLIASRLRPHTASTIGSSVNGTAGPTLPTLPAATTTTVVAAAASLARSAASAGLGGLVELLDVPSPPPSNLGVSGAAGGAPPPAWKVSVRLTR